MTGIFQTYIGIDVHASRKPYFYTAINGNLEILACGPACLADILAFLSGQSSALVAVNGPVCIQSPDGGSFQGGLFFESHTEERYVHHRSGDDELASRGFNTMILPRKTPPWVERSLDLTAGFRQLGFSVFGTSNSSRAYFETNCDAGFWLSFGAVPYDSRSLEGRLQRQLVLCEFGFPVQDPLIFLEEFTRHRLQTSQLPADQILPGYELKAMIASATALLFDQKPGAVETVGDPNNGALILPKEFSRRVN